MSDAFLQARLNHPLSAVSTTTSLHPPATATQSVNPSVDELNSSAIIYDPTTFSPSSTNAAFKSSFFPSIHVPKPAAAVETVHYPASAYTHAPAVTASPSLAAAAASPSMSSTPKVHHAKTSSQSSLYNMNLNANSLNTTANAYTTVSAKEKGVSDGSAAGPSNSSKILQKHSQASPYTNGLSVDIKPSETADIFTLSHSNISSPTHGTQSKPKSTDPSADEAVEANADSDDDLMQLTATLNDTSRIAIDSARHPNASIAVSPLKPIDTDAITQMQKQSHQRRVSFSQVNDQNRRGSVEGNVLIAHPEYTATPRYPHNETVSIDIYDELADKYDRCRDEVFELRRVNNSLRQALSNAMHNNKSIQLQDRVTELEQQLAASLATHRTLTDQIRLLDKQIKQEHQTVVDYPDIIAKLMDENRGLKERHKVDKNQFYELELRSRKHVEYTVDLERKCRRLQDQLQQAKRASSRKVEAASNNLATIKTLNPSASVPSLHYAINPRTSNNSRPTTGIPDSRRSTQQQQRPESAAQSRRTSYANEVREAKPGLTASRQQSLLSQQHQANGKVTDSAGNTARSSSRKAPATPLLNKLSPTNSSYSAYNHSTPLPTVTSGDEQPDSSRPTATSPSLQVAVEQPVVMHRLQSISNDLADVFPQQLSPSNGGVHSYKFKAVDRPVSMWSTFHSTAQDTSLESAPVQQVATIDEQPTSSADEENVDPVSVSNNSRHNGIPAHPAEVSKASAAVDSMLDELDNRPEDSSKLTHLSTPSTFRVQSKLEPPTTDQFEGSVSHVDYQDDFNEFPPEVNV